MKNAFDRCLPPAFLILAIFSTLANSALGQNLYVGYSNTNQIWSYPLGGGSPTLFTSSDLDNPTGMVISNGTMYVSNAGNNTITAYTASNPTGTVFANASNGISSPYALVISGGNMYVANDGGNNIEQFSLSGGGASGTSFVTGISGPVLLALDGNGNIYANSGGDLMQYSLAVGSSSAVFYNGNIDFEDSESMVISNGNLYVTNMPNSRIDEFSLATAFASPTTFATTGLHDPAGLALDGNGNLFASNLEGSTVEEYSLAGGDSSAMQFASGVPIGQSEPDAMAVGMVPEPSTGLALLGGFGVLLLWRRRLA